MAEQLKISSFFKVVQQLPAIDPDETKNEPVHSHFYKECLQEHCECQDERCLKAKSEINQKKELIRAKILKVEEAIELCSKVLFDKDEEIINLRKQFDSIETSEHIGSLSEISSQQHSTEEKPLSFIAFAKEFSTEELSFLRSFRTTKSDDSTFVATTMKYLYKQNLSVLKEKSVTGRSTKAGEKKEPITPEKYDVISNIFTERINLIMKDAIERNNRIKSINKLIKDAIHNINKATQTSEIEKNACKHLDFDK